MLSIQETCVSLGIGLTTFYKLRARGEAPRTVRIGARNMVPKKELYRWVEQRSLLAN